MTVSGGGEAQLNLDFIGQEPLPPAAIERVAELMGSGKLFRYGEAGGDQADAAMLEAEFAALLGRKYCVAFNSCGASLAAALIAAGVQRDEPVMMNAFTLAPVPGSIEHAGAKHVFVDITESYHIDLEDLRRQHERTGSKWLMLSYMRGHIPNLDDVFSLCEELGVSVIEDCAHTMGGNWDGKPTGTFGIAGCFSTQTFKHANSGEGGLLVTDDEDIAAKATLLSGSYMLYGQHGAGPSAEVFEKHRLTTPNFSMRMSALAAALVRPQLDMLDERAAVWNGRYDELAARLAQIDGVRIPVRDEREQFVASSIQFNLPGHDDIAGFVQRCGERGVPLKWFGAEDPVGFTSRFDHWLYASEGSLYASDQAVPRAGEVLSTMLDMRIPLAMTAEQAQQICDVIEVALSST